MKCKKCNGDGYSYEDGRQTPTRCECQNSHCISSTGSDVAREWINANVWDGEDRHCPASSGSILSIVPISEEVAERANARYQWQMKDWNKNFRHRMDFHEYHYRGKLNADVAAGHIGEDQAFYLLEKYTQSNTKDNHE